MNGRPATYDQARDRAAGKGLHAARPGTSRLGVGYWWHRAGSDECAGQLRTAYVRKSRPTVLATVAGRPTWTPIGIVCDGCHAYWPKPAEE